jgi:2-C-methyl-D-erythritol 4-phosphate cytidylyltransferase / 2-C-methyl-D-erythritol 2,4-cyclodiphosphate synthase
VSKTVAIIVAAGKGERAGGGVPKQFRAIGGKALVAHAYDCLSAHPEVNGVVLVIGTGQQDQARAALGERPMLAMVEGGATRRESVLSGLKALDDVDRVLIHDAARPFVPRPVLDRLLAALDEHAGVAPVLPIADTVAFAGPTLGDPVDRSTLLRVQTPQAFRFSDVMAAHLQWQGTIEPTDDAQMVRALGRSVAAVQGDAMLDKITWPEDFSAAEARFGQRSFRTGMGFDVHRLVQGEELWLGGIQIPHTHGLLGHSDADVALHALTDAILGAIGAGDIGTHFPPSDPQWRGAPSARFLEHAAALVETAGGRIEHADLTIICEAPKIGPYRQAICTRIAELLRVKEGRISVKATTTERLGFTGRGEGIAAQAVATISIHEVAE